MSDFENSHSECLLTIEKWFLENMSWVITTAKVGSRNGRVYTHFESSLELVNMIRPGVFSEQDEHSEFINSLCEDYHDELGLLGLEMEKEFPGRNWVIEFESFDLNTESIEMKFED